MRGHTGSTPGEEGIRAARRDAAEHKARHTLEYYQVELETIDPDSEEFRDWLDEHGVCFHQLGTGSGGPGGGEDVIYRSLKRESLNRMIDEFWKTGDEQSDLEQTEKITAHRVSIL